MVRPAAIIVFALLVFTLCAGAAAPAGAIPITKDIYPTPLRLFSEPGEGDATGVAAAPSAVAYTCGHEVRPGHGDDIVVRKVGSGGWTRYWDAAAHGTERAWDVAYASAKAVYVVGSYTKATGIGAVLLKYAPGGKLLWARKWAGPAGGAAAARCVVFATNGDVYVAGDAWANGERHVYGARYTPGGRRLWVKVYTGAYFQSCEDACRGGDGGLYIAGQYEATNSSSTDGLLLRCSPTGKVSWVKTYDAVGSWDGFRAACARPAGGVYVVGTSETDGDDYDGVLFRYTSSGGVKVIARLGASDNAYTELYDVVRTTDARIVVCGGYSVGSGPTSFVVASYTEAGAENWYHAWASASGSSRAECLVARGSGAVAASGFWGRENEVQHVMTYFINAAGIRRARADWDGATDGETWPRDMAARGTSVWVAGTCYGLLTGQDGFAMRLVP